MVKNASAVVAALFVLTCIAVPLFAAGDPAVAASSPDDWEFVSVRDETAPRSSVISDQTGGNFGLSIAGNGSAISDGRWAK